METDKVFRQYRARQERFHGRLQKVQIRINSIVERLEREKPSPASLVQLDGLRRDLERLFQDELQQAATFIDYLRRLEESNRRAKMAENRPRPQRNQAQIEQLSEELTTKLRLERLDNAMKELLDFLADTDFFAANATTARRRRLRTLQDAIEKALQK